MNLSPRDLRAQPPTLDELRSFGIGPSEAEDRLKEIGKALRLGNASECWCSIAQNVVTPELPFDFHRWLFQCVYQQWDDSEGPAPAWLPPTNEVESANVSVLGRQHGYSEYRAFWEWSTRDRGAFWRAIIQTLGIQFAKPDPTQGSVEVPIASWLPSQRLNIVDSCFRAPPSKTAILQRDELGCDRSVTYGELLALVNRVANGVVQAGFRPGDRLGFLLPMTIESVAAYLGVIKAGCVPVSIAESFAAPEIRSRMEIADACAIFVTDEILRGGKQLPCMEKWLQCDFTARAILIPRSDTEPPELGDQVVLWQDFLATSTEFDSVLVDHDHESNILFSSGTTGQPKAIPWTHTTPIKCAADGYLHQNIHHESVACWPTSLGWMMGPWLIYAGLMNRATLAIFDGAANRPEFCQFVQDAKVTMLGVVPSLVRAWRSADMIDGLDWGAIEVFSSTGECSNPDDMLYLMSRARYRPVIEYCGGTEIGGGYLSSTVVQANAPSTFTTAAMGLDFVLLDGDQSVDEGEVFLIGPSLGLSQRLLNSDHEAVYFNGAPEVCGLGKLRRHGDQLHRYPNGYYRACGRTDDSMNLGGIKVSAVALEACANRMPGVSESAAVAAASVEGGPGRLVFFVVMDAGQDPLVPQLKSDLQQAISGQVNPLFRVADVRVVRSLPRTASNKLLRRDLRAMVEGEE